VDIKIVNRHYEVFISDKPNEYMIENNLQAYCDYNRKNIVISKTFLDGDNKSIETIKNDLLHECIHAYFNEIGIEDLNNEYTVNIITALILNNSINYDVSELIDDVFQTPII